MVLSHSIGLPINTYVSCFETFLVIFDIVTTFGAYVYYHHTVSVSICLFYEGNKEKSVTIQARVFNPNVMFSGTYLSKNASQKMLHQQLQMQYKKLHTLSFSKD